MRNLSSLWQYKSFIAGVVKREFKLRFSGSLLGVSWNIINPLVLIMVYTLVFSNLLHNKLSGNFDHYAYSIYLCAGLLPWGFFTEVISRSQTLFLDNDNLLKKSNFPRLCLPIILVSTAIINFAIIFGLFLLFLIITHHFPGLNILAFLPVMLIQLMIATGLGIFTGTLNVFFRDIGNCMGIILQLWFWLTPIVYPIDILSNKVSSWVMWNPMVPVINAYQDIFLRQAEPHWTSLIPAFVLGVVMLLLGALAFRALSNELVDEL